MFHWGAVHTVSGQALAFNFELSDHFGLTAPADVELRLEDKNGNLVYDKSMTVTPGHGVTWVITLAQDARTAGKTIDSDTHGIIAIDIHTLIPCLKVTYPPGPSSPVDSMPPTLEVMDVASGRVLDFANNPHTILQ
jgi:hypothetical protein